MQFVLTRYLADKEYSKQKEKMVPALTSALIVSLLISLAASVPWYLLNQGTLLYKGISIALFVIIGSIWTMMDFLSCLKQYMSIVVSFFLGSFLSVVLLLILGNFTGLEGALAGYTAGQLGILIMLLSAILREYKFSGFYNAEFLKYFKKFPYLFLTGLFYNLGLWIDKLIGWVFLGEKVYGSFKSFSLYDTPTFIAYLSIIPSLAYFIIQSETRFYLAHRKFFDSISKEPLDNILQYKEQLGVLLKRTLSKLFLVQFVTSLTGALSAQFIIAWFGLPPGSIPILRTLFFAAGGQVLFLYTIIFLMYFDLAHISFLMVSVFFTFNLSLNILSLYYPIFTLGTAYLFAIIFSFLLGLGLLLRSVSDIEFQIFLRQEN
ncbi:hypothetical protein ES703_57654 [subsurface metagenome]